VTDDPRTQVKGMKEIGRYALGVDWGDGHESIYPYRTMRRACPCDACTERGDVAPTPEQEKPKAIELLGGRSLFVSWSDDHETLLLVDELRALCRCARCAGEPDYPISGR
jgi:DUF971 family protein